MLIAFAHNNKAFLPEISAYMEFFASKGISCEVTRPDMLNSLRPDVAWHFMGTDHQKPSGALTIHEYTSASVPPAAGVKDLYKRMFNTRPDYRLFLNEFVRTAFSFNDNIPFGYRDMGVPAAWLNQTDTNADKKYDFIYVGTLKQRNIQDLLKIFNKGSMMTRTFLIVSKDYQTLSPGLRQYRNVFFDGPVAHERIPSLISKARFAINFMPDEAPFNRQTSTKLLEYAACKIPVITSDYYWMRNFQSQYGGSYFYLEKDLSNFTWETISAFDYAFPDLSDWTWEKQIRRSGVLNFLEQKFPGVNLTTS